MRWWPHPTGVVCPVAVVVVEVGVAGDIVHPPNKVVTCGIVAIPPAVIAKIGCV